MKVGEDELETCTLSGGHPTDLMQRPVGVQDSLHPHMVEVTSQQEIYLVNILHPQCVDNVDHTINSFFLKWTSWSNVDFLRGLARYSVHSSATAL